MNLNTKKKAKNWNSKKTPQLTRQKVKGLNQSSEQITCWVLHNRWSDFLLFFNVIINFFHKELPYQRLGTRLWTWYIQLPEFPHYFLALVLQTGCKEMPVSQILSGITNNEIPASNLLETKWKTWITKKCDNAYLEWDSDLGFCISHTRHSIPCSWNLLGRCKTN